MPTFVSLFSGVASPVAEWVADMINQALENE